MQSELFVLIQYRMIYEIVFEQPLAVAGAHLLPNSVSLHATLTQPESIADSFKAAMTVFAPVLGLFVKRTRRFKWWTVICSTGPITAMALLVTLNPDSPWIVKWLSVVPMGAGFSGLLTVTLSE